MSGGRPSSWSSRLADDVAEHVAQVRVGLAGLRGVVETALHPGPLLGHDLVELSPDVAQDVVEAVSLERLLALPLETLHEVAQAGHVAAGRVARPPAAVHQAAERLGQVALGHDVVGEGIEDLVGVEVGDMLAAVPGGIARRAGQRVGGRLRARAADRRAPDPAPDRVDPGSTRSPVVDRPAGHAVLVEPPRQMEALEQELDGRGDDRGLLGAVGDVVRAETIDRPSTARAPRASRRRTRAPASDRRSRP